MSSLSSTSLGVSSRTQSPTSIRNPRVTEKSSSVDLLKHLQDRVKKLRAENENLKKISANDSSNRSKSNVSNFGRNRLIRSYHAGESQVDFHNSKDYRILCGLVTL